MIEGSQIRRCICGESFSVKYKGQRYHSRECQHLQRHIDSKKKRKRICQWCGKEFIMRWMSGKAKKGEVKEGLFCSRKCRGLWRINQPKKDYPSCKVYFPTCLVCKMRFTAKYSDQKCCSDKCRYKEFKKNQRKKYRNDNGLIKRKINCIVCGKEIETWFEDQILCSSLKCRNRYSRKNRGGGDYKKRAKHFNVEYEYINVMKIFKRDNWHCQICGKATPEKNRGKRYTNSPELDHRIPMSKGGGHLYSNVQCACRRCNGLKSNNNEIGQYPLYEIRSAA